MSNYGVQIFNIDGVEVVGPSQNVHMMDFFYLQGSGSKSYPLNAGEELIVEAVINGRGGSHYSCQAVYVSGGNISWTIGPPGPNIFSILVLKRGVA